ncbi:MAG: hypothetical protein GXY55_15125 [Phycisphaerae bacterium]|nr:hypothetical protein [Phycisphaerae bacterium]
MWPFGRRNALDEREINWKEFGLLVETNPTKIYVNCLILHLYDGDRHPCVLRPSEPLPEVPHYDLDEQPPIQRVVNRLKVMAGLDPVHFPQPRDGRIELQIRVAKCFLHVRFNDTGPDPSVTLRLEEVRARAS